ncbi:MAG: NAD-dependent epimerase/dehydratase family protein [Sphingomonas fennica]
MSGGPIAVTGGTGFVGSHLIRMAAARGHAVRALARRPQPPLAGVEWVAGALDDDAALAKLVAGAAAVIHLAGVVTAPDRAAFAAGNVAGTAAMAAATRAAGVLRFVHVSSLSAREPGLSAYGWSKRESEGVLDGLAATIVRPPAIYGPRDTEMLELFRMARHGFVLLPPGGRLSIVAVEDLCRLLLDVVDRPGTVGALYEPDDGVEAGHSHAGLARMIGAAVGRRVRPLAVPRRVLALASAADRAVRRGGAKLTADRVAMYSHHDWVAGATARPPAAVWQPEVETAAGLVATAAWYRANGWLK